MSIVVYRGTVLDVSQAGFDCGGAAFASIFYEQESMYLLYTGAVDVEWSRTGIGLAESTDGVNFKKLSDVNPILEWSRQYGNPITPVVFCVSGYFYMLFAGTVEGQRRIYVAKADDIKGPWRYVKELIRPEQWEDKAVDLGPSVAKLTEDQVLAYYSTVPWGGRRGSWFGIKYPVRRIGILRIKVRSPNNIEAHRFEGNPLKHLNGPKGSWNESVFCPGYFLYGDEHYFLPSASTYSVGFPYRQYIGLANDSSPYFQNPNWIKLLINGPRDKDQILEGKGEVALDTPCPVIKDGQIYLFYAAMKRDLETRYGVWKTQLAVFPLLEIQRCNIEAKLSFS